MISQSQLNLMSLPAATVINSKHMTLFSRLRHYQVRNESQCSKVIFCVGKPLKRVSSIKNITPSSWWMKNIFIRNAFRSVTQTLPKQSQTEQNFAAQTKLCTSRAHKSVANTKQANFALTWRKWYNSRRIRCCRAQGNTRPGSRTPARASRPLRGTFGRDTNFRSNAVRSCPCSATQPPKV